jgi:hypothetical protein
MIPITNVLPFDISRYICLRLWFLQFDGLRRNCRSCSTGNKFASNGWGEGMLPGSASMTMLCLWSPVQRLTTWPYCLSSWLRCSGDVGMEMATSKQALLLAQSGRPPYSDTHFVIPATPQCPPILFSVSFRGQIENNKVKTPWNRPWSLYSLLDIDFSVHELHHHDNGRVI